MIECLVDADVNEIAYGQGFLAFYSHLVVYFYVVKLAAGKVAPGFFLVNDYLEYLTFQHYSLSPHEYTCVYLLLVGQFFNPAAIFEFSL
jgi:hypothetical protein